MRILESQQLLEVKRGRGGGAVVQAGPAGGRPLRRPAAATAAHHLAHLEEARSVIEPSAAQQVAVLDGTDHLDALQALYETERASGDALSFVTAMSEFDQAVTELSGNRTLAVIAGVFRDIYAGQIYASVKGSDAPLAQRIAWRVIASHSAFSGGGSPPRRVAGAGGVDGLPVHHEPNAGEPNVSRQPIDADPPTQARNPRRALSVATEIRARIAEGRRLRAIDCRRWPSSARSSTSRDPPCARRCASWRWVPARPAQRHRGSAVIRTPSTRGAAQQAGIVLEARRPPCSTSTAR